MLELVWLVVPRLAVKYCPLSRYRTSCDLNLLSTSIKCARTSHKVLPSLNAFVTWFTVTFYLTAAQLITMLGMFVLVLNCTHSC